MSEPVPPARTGGGIMQQKWFGIPAPIIIVAGIAIAFWLWSKHSSSTSTSGTTTTPASTTSTTFFDFIGGLTGKKRKKKPKPHKKPPVNGTKRSPVSPAAVFPAMQPSQNGVSAEEGQVSDNPQPAPPDYSGTATTTMPVDMSEDMSGRNQEVPT